MARPENQFPTIRDAHDALSHLIECGFGDLPLQIIIAPDSTMQAIARVTAGKEYDRRPALMIDIAPGAEGRMPVALICADRMSYSHPAGPLS